MPLDAVVVRQQQGPGSGAAFGARMARKFASSSRIGAGTAMVRSATVRVEPSLARSRSRSCCFSRHPEDGAMTMVREWHAVGCEIWERTKDA